MIKKSKMMVLLIVTILVSSIFGIIRVSASDGCYVEVDENSKTETSISYSVKCEKDNYINIVEIKDSGIYFSNQVNYKEKEKITSYNDTYIVDAKRLYATIYIRVQYFNSEGKNTKSSEKKVEFGLTRIPEYEALAVSETEAAICITNNDDGIYQNYFLNDKSANYLSFGNITVNGQTYTSCFTKLGVDTNYSLKFCRGNNEECTEEINVMTPKGEKNSNIVINKDSSEKAIGEFTLGSAKNVDKSYNIENGNIGCTTTVQDIVDEYWKYIMILAPVGLILLITFDFVKAITSSSDDQLKKSSNDALKRTIATVVLLMLPVLLKLVLGWFGIELCI